MHGEFCEDGKLQGLFELAGVPYVGPDTSASVVCMDKTITKLLVAEGSGVRQAAYRVAHRRDFDKNPHMVVREIETRFCSQYPLFVKPASAGSSVGVSKANGSADLLSALELAFGVCDKVLVEEAIVGREIEVAVLGNENPEASLAGEILAANDFYDYEAKYENPESRTIVPAKISDRDSFRLRDAALAVYRSLGCAGIARVDFFLCNDGEIVFNEINTLPGFTDISMFPMLWSASGIPYIRLVEKMCSLAIERNGLKMKDDGCSRMQAGNEDGVDGEDSSRGKAASAHRYEVEAPKYQPVVRDPRLKSRYIPVSEGEYELIAQSKSKDDVVRITCVGDMLCEEKLYRAHVFREGFDFSDVFSFARPVLMDSDLSIGNLETTICESSPYTGESYKIDDKYHCNAPQEFLEAVKTAGFDFLMMSNNHNLDSGLDGVMETLDRVEDLEMMHTGLFRPNDFRRFAIVSAKGMKIGLLSYSTWFNRNESRFSEEGRNKILNPYDPGRVRADIEEARRQGAEFILVYIHWGIDAEYSHSRSQRMMEMAVEIADSGADYIVGSHTHSLQEYAHVVDKSGRWVPCIFSLGNFVTSERASISRKSAILSIELERRNGTVCVKREKFIPCFVPDDFCGIKYPIVPEPDSAEGQERLPRNIRDAHAQARAAIGQDRALKQYFTKRDICLALGLPVPDRDEAYTTINFARDARKGGIAVLSEITSDPAYREPTTKLPELAEIATNKGARLLLSSEQVGSYPCLIVDDVFAAYQALITGFRNRFSPRTIGITGSIGKTTATEMVYTLIKSKYANTHRNTGSANNVRYAGNVIQQLKPEHGYYVQEVMEGPPFGAASTISKMVQPQAAIVTVVGTSHYEAFGSQERILESCLGIQDGMPDDGLLILNGDDPLQWDSVPRRNVVYYAIDNEKADYRAVNIRSDGLSLTFDVLHGESVTTCNIHCFGKHNVLDALAAFAAGVWANMSDEEIVKGLAAYHTSGIRQNLVRYGGYSIYLDCYNAAPESIKSSLEAFSMISAKGKHVAVLADILETGEQESQFHEDVGDIANDSCADVLIFFGPRMKLAADRARQLGRTELYHTEDTDELKAIIRSVVTQDDVTLYKGSHGMKLEQIVDQLYGTWFHEEFDRYDFKTEPSRDDCLTYCIYPEHAVVTGKHSTSAEVNIPDYIEGVPVTGIEKSAFNRSAYTKKVVFPNSLESVRYCSFYRADKIEEVELPPSLRVIERSAFSTCASLRKVAISQGCTHIGFRAFGNCRNLETIYIPDSVVQIDDEAFLNCDKLTICCNESSTAEKYALDHGIKTASSSFDGGGALLT